MSGNDDDDFDLEPPSPSKSSKKKALDPIPVHWPARTDTRFWSDPDKWPRDQPGYVFLARAFDEVGRAMFGQHWTGKECSTYPMPNIDPGLVARLMVVQEEIAKRCQSGELVLAIRPVLGGEMREAPASWWKTERVHYRNRFYGCQINPKDPFGGGLGSAIYCWLYVTRESLNKFLANKPFVPKPTFPSHLSPYLRVMIDVTRRLDITPGHQSLKREVTDAIASAWAETGRDKLSPSLLEAMGTCVREPESRGGRPKGKKI